MDPMELTNYTGCSTATFIQRDPVACRIAKVRENGDSDVAGAVGRPVRGLAFEWLPRRVDETRRPASQVRRPARPLIPAAAARVCDRAAADGRLPQDLAAPHRLPVRTGERVTRLRPVGGGGDGFEITCGTSRYRARDVIVATGRSSDLPFLYAFASMLVLGAGRDAGYVVDQITRRRAAEREPHPGRST
jgi:hypothetical protein